MKAVVVDSKITDLFTSFDIEKEMLAKENIDLAVENVTSQSEYIEACRDADALLLIGTKTPKEVIDHLEKCKVIVRYGVGYDVVDIESCSAAGIVVCNVPDASITDVSGHAFTLALDCMRKVTYYDRQIRQGNWHSGCGYGLHRFSKYTFGFCGFGNIARATAEHVKALGCRMVAYDPYIRDEVFAAMGVERVSFDELLAQSDVISIHTPLSKETFHMFSKEQFEKMKPGVMLVNTSRGGVVDQEHLMDAIDAGIVTAASAGRKRMRTVDGLKQPAVQLRYHHPHASLRDGKRRILHHASDQSGADRDRRAEGRAAIQRVESGIHPEIPQ